MREGQVLPGEYAIWPCLAIVALLLCLVGTPLFRAADTAPGRATGRLATLDGLRGFLALGVVFHHVAIFHRFLQDGTWALPPSGVYVMVGQGGVALFFMITGFLFWSRLIAEGGRFRWVPFYVGRVFRLAPLYLVAVAVLMLTVLMRDGWAVRVPAGQFAIELGRWLALGALPQISFDGDPAALLILAGVTWTLKFEWSFYLCLLPAAMFARTDGLHSPFALAVVGTGLARIAVPGVPADLWAIAAALFGCGMVSASLHRHGARAVLSDSRRSWIVVALLAVLSTCDEAFAVLPILLMACLFHLVAGGCTLFGLLTSRSARRLGDVSYGIYLLQGPVLLAAYTGLRGFALSGPSGHWIVALLAVTALVAIATVMHVAIERPGIRLGRVVARRLTPAVARVDHRASQGPI